MPVTRRGVRVLRLALTCLLVGCTAPVPTEPESHPAWTDPNTGMEFMWVSGVFRDGQ